jgi:hypothetical protein
MFKFVVLFVLIQLRMILVEVLDIDANVSFQCFQNFKWLLLQAVHSHQFPCFLFNRAVIVYESLEQEVHLLGMLS